MFWFYRFTFCCLLRMYLHLLSPLFKIWININTYLPPLLLIWFWFSWFKLSTSTYLPYLRSDLDLVGSEYIDINLPPLFIIWLRRSVIAVTSSTCLSSGTLSKWVITTTTGHPGARACMLHSQGFSRSISEVPPLMLQTTWNQSIHHLTQSQNRAPSSPKFNHSTKISI